MEIRLEKKLLMESLRIGGGMAGKSRAIPMHDNVRIVFEFDNGLMRVMSTSTECSVMHKVSIGGLDSAIGNISLLVNPGDMLSGLRSISDNDVVLRISDTNKSLSIVHKKGVIELLTYDEDNFALISVADSNVNFRLDSALLSNWLMVSKDFCSTNVLFPAMNGMLLYGNGDEVGMCATDSRNLYTDCINIETSEFRSIIPMMSFNVIRDILANSNNAMIAISDNSMTITTEYSRVITKLVNGTFPNFERVIPTAHSISIGISKKELLDSLNRVSLYTDKANGLTELNIEGMMCKIKGYDSNLGKSAVDECMVEHNGADIRIGVSSRVMLNSVSVIQSDDIEMLMESTNKPIVLKDKERPCATVLAMPMVIS